MATGGRSGLGLAAAVGVGTAVGWSMSNVGAVAPELAPAYHLSIASVGLLTTVVFVVHTLMQIPAGRLADRFGPKKMGLLGMAMMAGASAVALPAPEPWLAFLARTLLGFGTGISFMAGIEYARQTSGSAFALGMFGASTGLGSGLAVAVVPQVYHLVHWRAPFLTAAIIPGLALLLLAAGPADTPLRRHAKAAGAGAGTGGLGARATLRDKRVWRLGLMMAIPGGMSLILGTWVVTLLVKAGGSTTGEAGIVGSFVMIAGIVTRPLSGWVMRSHPHWMRLIFIGSCGTGVLGTLAIVQADSLALAAVGSVLVGLSSGMPFAYAYTVAPRVRPDAPAVASSIVNATGLTFIVSSIPLMGVAFSLPGHGRIGFLVAAGLWALAALFAPPREERKAPDAAAPRETRGATAGEERGEAEEAVR